MNGTTPPGRAPVARPIPTSLASVAARAGVSIATVSRVLNGVTNRASAETVQRVREAAEALDYAPSRAGRALRQGRSGLVVLLVPNIANPAMAALAAGCEAALRQDGLTLVLCDTGDQASLQDEHLRTARALRAEVIVLAGAVASPGLARMSAEGAPLLFVNRRCPSDPAAPFIGIDNRSAGAEIAYALAASGLGPAAAIHGSLDSSATAERVEGFREAARATGLGLVGWQPEPAPPQDHLRIGQAAATRLLRGPVRPRSMFCTSDLIAFGAHRAAVEAGVNVADALALVGFDDNPLNDWVAPWLASVAVPYDALGAAVAEAIRDPVGRPRGMERILPHRLVRRGVL